MFVFLFLFAKYLKISEIGSKRFTLSWFMYLLFLFGFDFILCSVHRLDDGWRARTIMESNWLKPKPKLIDSFELLLFCWWSNQQKFQSNTIKVWSSPKFLIVVQHQNWIIIVYVFRILFSFPSFPSIPFLFVFKQKLRFIQRIDRILTCVDSE